MNTRHNEMEVPVSQFKAHKKSIFTKLLCLFTILDNTIEQMYLNIISNVDNVVNEGDIPNFAKKLLNVRQVLFHTFYLSNFLLLYYNTTTTVEIMSHVFMMKISAYYCLIISFVMLNSLILFLRFKDVDQMTLTPKEEIERIILRKNPDLMKNKCQHCNVTRCMRSQHCSICNKCVIKYELHSHWFNLCIGSVNCLPYTIVLLWINLYFVVSLILMTIQIFFDQNDYDFKGKEFRFHLWFAVLVYCQFKIFLFTKEFIWMGVLKNMTDYEGHNWRRLPYMWKSPNKHFYNPFDKGFKFNLKELWKSFRNPGLESDSRVSDTSHSIINLDDDVSTILEVIEDKELDTIVDNLTTDPNKPPMLTHFDKLNKPFEPVTSYDKQIVYCRYDQNEIINWTRIRLFTVFDVPNSPFREILVSQVKYIN